ncbi:MAG TPA: tetratricopeptide repeat protein [Bryobacteraceae bacterium]|nr:tetratricopeptide repeat protein [Bryobacteraceae bacterium]
MAESVFARMWNAVKPPPAAPRPESPPRLTPQQKRLLWSTFSVAMLGVTGWAVYAYIATAPQRAEQEFQAGMRLMQPGNYKNAIAHFNRALAISPKLATVYYERGVAHRLTNQDDNALADFEQAVALNANLAPAYIGIGSIDRDRRDLSHAMEQYTKSIEVQPTVDAYFERGQIYELLGEHQKAIGDYNRAIEELPDAPAVYRARAYARRNLGDEAGYIADRDTATSIEHRNNPAGSAGSVKDIGKAKSTERQ